MSNIKNLFPTNVYIKDWDKDEDWINTIKAITKTVFSAEQAKNGDYDETGNEDLPLFTKEMLEKYDILHELRQMFVDAFYELYDSYDYSEEGQIEKQSKEELEARISTVIGRLPFMREGSNKSIHFHQNMAAFAIFYLTDVDNKNHGGELVLYDPAMTPHYEFSCPKKAAISTKKARMIVAPGYMWHEVTDYKGTDERLAIVINLSVRSY